MADTFIPRLAFSPSTLVDVLDGKQDYNGNARAIDAAAEFLYSAARGCKRLYGQSATEIRDEFSVFRKNEDFRNYRLILMTSPHAFSQTASEIINQLENCADCLKILEKRSAESEEIVSSFHKSLARAFFYSIDGYIEKVSDKTDKDKS